MFHEEDLLPISALQHILFCERQCALIHIESVWAENRLTMEGKHLHEKVHGAGAESRGDLRIARGVRLRSLELGLTGVADVVEFHQADSGVHLSGASGQWLPFPVEYKRGRPKAEPWDAVQLCAQASCLEEMLSVVIPSGAIFYGTTRRREDVAFDEHLRSVLHDTVRKLRLLFELGTTPPSMYEKKCGNCSLLQLCLPKTAGRGKSATSYLASGIVA